jgi:hypothetical protein
VGARRYIGLGVVAINANARVRGNVVFAGTTARRYGAIDERAAAGFATACYTTGWDTTSTTPWKNAVRLRRTWEAEIVATTKNPRRNGDRIKDLTFGTHGSQY